MWKSAGQGRRSKPEYRQGVKDAQKEDNSQDVFDTAFGAVHIGGTVKHLDEYSVGIMEQIVKNRNLILSNNMTHQWTDISGEYGIANSCFEEILEERNLTLREFMEDEEAKNELLKQLLLPGLDILRRNGVNGVYFVLADGLKEPQKEKGNEVYTFVIRTLT